MGIPNFRAMRQQVEEIRTQKAITFPKYSLVQVDSERFHGIGIVADSDMDGCPLEKLAVRVESLNIWWYPIEDCQPFTGKIPSWIRTFFRKQGIRHLALRLTSTDPSPIEQRILREEAEIPSET
jgi:hypothetical protein